MTPTTKQEQRADPDLAQLCRDRTAADPLGSYQKLGLAGDGRLSGKTAKVLCPLHPDEKTPSFVVYLTGESAGTFHCFGCGKGGDIFDFAGHLHHLTTFPDKIAFVGDRLGIAEPVKSRTVKPKVVKKTKWEVKHPDGRVFWHWREDLVAGDKDYKWQQPGGPWELPEGVTSKGMLYGLDELADVPDGERVFVTEGEKARDACKAAGLFAVATVCGSTSTPTPGVLAHLRRFDPVLWPDADPDGKGQRHMGAIAGMLGQPCKVVEWPDAPPKGDAADYFAAGGTVEGLGALIAERPLPQAAETPEPEVRVLRPVTWTQCEREAAVLSWLWSNWMPNGSATVIAGDTGFGKTWFALALCGSVIEGWAWPDGTEGPEPGLVLWIEGEARLRINLERAKGMGISTDGFLGMENPWRAYYLDHDDDFAEVDAMVRHIRPRLVVVDSWNRCYAAKENDAEVRHTLDRVTRLADETDSCWALLQQVRKPTMLDDTENFDLHTIRGSTCLINAATGVIGIDMVKGNRETRRVTCAKHTMSATEPDLIGFTVKEGKVFFGAPPETTKRHLKSDDAFDFLRQFIGSGEKTPHETVEAAAARGIAEKTLKLARQSLCDTLRLPGAETVWVWRLKDGEK